MAAIDGFERHSACVTLPELLTALEINRHQAHAITHVHPR
jgi:hypothetical protein